MHPGGSDTVINLRINHGKWSKAPDPVAVSICDSFVKQLDELPDFENFFCTACSTRDNYPLIKCNFDFLRLAPFFLCRSCGRGSNNKLLKKFSLVKSIRLKTEVRGNTSMRFKGGQSTNGSLRLIETSSSMVWFGFEGGSAGLSNLTSSS